MSVKLLVLKYTHTHTATHSHTHAHSREKPFRCWVEVVTVKEAVETEHRMIIIEMKQTKLLSEETRKDPRN